MWILAVFRSHHGGGRTPLCLSERAAGHSFIPLPWYQNLLRAGMVLCVHAALLGIHRKRDCRGMRGAHIKGSAGLTQALFGGICLRARLLPSMSLSRVAIGAPCSDTVAPRLASRLLGFEKVLPQPDAQFHSASLAVDSLPFKVIHCTLGPGPNPPVDGYSVPSNVRQ